MPKNQTANKFWKFVNINDDETELQLYSDIASRQSTDWFGDVIGDEVTPKNFLAELKEVKSNNICVRINSNGGDVFAANAIAVALEEEVRNGKHVSCKIDGICASAAVRVALACEKISIANGAYMMIHKPMNVLWGYYNAEELTDMAKTLDTIQNGIADAYEARTGVSAKECSKLMDKETWFTAKEAVEKGFADEILVTDGETEETADAVMNRIKTAFVNSVATKVFTKAPKALKEAFENKKIIEEGEKPMDVKNYNDLQTAYPELVKNAENKAREEGAKDELQRIKAIDALAGKISNSLLNEAKYGEVKMTAEEVIVKAFNEDKMLGKGYMNAAKADAEENEEVAGDAVEEETQNNEEEEAKNVLLAAAQNCRNNGGKK